ncbi:uncharacterized protein PHALS_00768 [Plasmopara halstedii]|uniref:Uncharacterized protein n=1 Tax=Plasmopara halstedii TaxID=4781 RepID=A0A0P1ARV6_PLAHL|nr:uncharacterized protein PHALS_00768 [Plasmopara halstedii]CEG44400.1 hypothetical protein PHALS_00768 [Plasmopara halstedii]|eukprot:XP_024580769.1 hypothetical protein PHALS_00768 [Plasmopara halstedii]
MVCGAQAEAYDDVHIEQRSSQLSIVGSKYTLISPYKIITASHQRLCQGTKIN